MIRWLEPLDSDPDGDGRNDRAELLAGTEPYVYNKKWDYHVEDFVKGVTLGDFIRNVDSVAVIMGQIVGRFFTVADARDVIANLVYGDYIFAGINLIGLIPAAGVTQRFTEEIKYTRKLLLKRL